MIIYVIVTKNYHSLLIHGSLDPKWLRCAKNLKLETRNSTQILTLLMNCRNNKEGGYMAKTEC